MESYLGSHLCFFFCIFLRLLFPFLFFFLRKVTLSISQLFKSSLTLTFSTRLFLCTPSTPHWSRHSLHFVVFVLCLTLNCWLTVSTLLLSDSINSQLSEVWGLPLCLEPTWICMQLICYVQPYLNEWWMKETEIWIISERKLQALFCSLSFFSSCSILFSLLSFGIVSTRALPCPPRGWTRVAAGQWQAAQGWRGCKFPALSFETPTFVLHPTDESLMSRVGVQRCHKAT